MPSITYLPTLVPEGAYPEVIEVIHAYLQRETDGAQQDDNQGQASRDPNPGASRDVVHVPGQGDWTPEMLQTIKDSCPYDAALVAIDAVTANPGRMTFYEDIVERSGLTSRVFQARMGAFTKFTKKNFGRKTWPFEWGYMGNRLFYRTPPEIATWWTAP